MSIINNFSLDYTYNEEEFTEETTCELNKVAPRKPNITITKTGSPNDVRIGDTISYRVNVQVSDGDDCFGEIIAKDIIDASTDFVEGTLKKNGVVVENQDLLHLEIELHPNSNIYFEYECIRTRL